VAGVAAKRGDEAHCAQLCDLDSDCLNQRDPGVFCNVTDGGGLETLGHGFCDWKE
jgi:hypothetical protein